MFGLTSCGFFASRPSSISLRCAMFDDLDINPLRFSATQRGLLRNAGHPEPRRPEKTALLPTLHPDPPTALLYRPEPCCLLHPYSRSVRSSRQEHPRSSAIPPDPPQRLRRRTAGRRPSQTSPRLPPASQPALSHIQSMQQHRAMTAMIRARSARPTRSPSLHTLRRTPGRIALSPQAKRHLLRFAPKQNSLSLIHISEPTRH